MKLFLFLTILSIVSIADGQQCQARFNRNITGQCSTIDACQGTLLTGSNCTQGSCCIPGQILPSSSCLTINQSDALYGNSSRTRYLRGILSHSLDLAEICSNCEAKAAFLVVAAAMTENFQTDESTKSDTALAADDNKYGNNQTGDGSRYRRRGLFGLRGRTMYQRLQTLLPQYQSVNDPEIVAVVENAYVIAARLWNNVDLLNGESLVKYADGSFYGFSMIWHKLGGDMGQLAAAAKNYSKFLRQLQCDSGDLYPGQGPVCLYNATHNGTCVPQCVKGLEDAGSYCGCSGVTVNSCSNSPQHIRCCLDTCSQELKMDLGFVLDSSGSVSFTNHQLQLNFTKDLLRRVNVGANKTHVVIINYSSSVQNLTTLNSNYTLQQKLTQIDNATYFGMGTNTALALRVVKDFFSYARGRRTVAEGVTPVIFIITDGQSDETNATIKAAADLKSEGILLISVGVGSGPDLNELHAICSPPVNENYFSISNYAALNQKLNQFTSKSCSEPSPVSPNNTVTTEIGQDKYKFFRVEIVMIGDKFLITVKIAIGNVKLFYSFIDRNPKDPTDFIDYETKKVDLDVKSNSMSLVIAKPNAGVQFAYVGVKGVEQTNKFEVTFADCAQVICTSPSNLSMKLINAFLLFTSLLILLLLSS